MNPTEIEVSYSRRVQLDRYEPVEVGTTITVSLDEGDDINDAQERYEDEVEDMVERAIAERVTQHKMNSDEDE